MKAMTNEKLLTEVRFRALGLEFSTRWLVLELARRYEANTSKPCDVVEVVRCKDCKYTDTVTCPITGAETLFCEYDIDPFATEPNGFCHRGERKGFRK